MFELKISELPQKKEFIYNNKSVLRAGPGFYESDTWVGNYLIVFPYWSGMVAYGMIVTSQACIPYESQKYPRVRFRKTDKNVTLKVE